MLARKDLTDFIRLPWKIYQNTASWVPPLISEEKKLFNPEVHPFYQHAELEFFLVRDSRGQPVGRVAAIINHNHNQFHKERIGFFGFFESINSPEVAHQLLDRVRAYLKSKGMEQMRGPMSFSTNEQCGLLVEGFDHPPVLMMPYNPPYYPALLESYGLSKIKDLYAYELDSSVSIPEKFRRVAERVKAKAGFTFRHLDLKRFGHEIEVIKQIYNDAWSNNWGFVPMTDAEFTYLAHSLKKIIDPDLVIIAEVEGKPAGFSLALPDYNMALKHLNGRLLPFGIFKLLWYSRNIRTLRLITLGLARKYQKRGIDVIFYLETIKQALAKGYARGELSWVLEDNDLMNRAILALGARLYKKYRIYEMRI
jgi:hypothetical protein